jgi:16S rRNA C1402 N4-methylase RsmH
MPVPQAYTPTMPANGYARKADSAEQAYNPRSRSALLRDAEKLPGDGRAEAA